MAISCEAAVVKFLGLVDKEIVNPDAAHNFGRSIGEAFIWDTIAYYAKKKSENLWEALEDQGFFDVEGLGAGQHLLTESPHFVLNAKISNPVKRFNERKLAEVLLKTYKVPFPITIEMVDQAKVETKPSVTLSISER